MALSTGSSIDRIARSQIATDRRAIDSIDKKMIAGVPESKWGLSLSQGRRAFLASQFSGRSVATG